MKGTRDAEYSMSIPRRRAFIVGLIFIWQGLLAYVHGDTSVTVEVGMEIVP